MELKDKKLASEAYAYIYKIPFVSLQQKFLFFVLKSSDVLDILVPILYYLNDARADQCERRRPSC